MTKLRSSRRLIKMWHRREKATIDHLVGALRNTKAASDSRQHSPFTASGLVVEDQVRKAWQPCGTGLAMF
jgi:hypothetical protein